MDRGIPEFNRLIARREYQLNKSLHRERLRATTKAIDNSVPIGYIYPINKKNKEALIEGKSE
jgi:hypothetical protein